MATLLRHIQYIMLKIHQYRVKILYKLGLEIFIADWLLWHNHVEGKDKPIKDMDMQVDAIQSSVDMPYCISIEEIQWASLQDAHLLQLKTFIIAGWLHNKDELQTNIRSYWSYRDKITVIDGVNSPVIKRLEGLFSTQPNKCGKNNICQVWHTP